MGLVLFFLFISLQNGIFKPFCVGARGHVPWLRESWFIPTSVGLPACHRLENATCSLQLIALQLEALLLLPYWPQSRLKMDSKGKLSVGDARHVKLII